MVDGQAGLVDYSFGAWIRQRRRALDLTQEELAGRAGFSVATIRKLENGQRRPSRQSAEILARLLEIPNEQQAEFLHRARQERPTSPQSKPGNKPGDDSAGDRSPASRSLNRLPVYSTPFFGRQAEIEQITELLSGPDCRLLSLTGPGGMGKTRLAVEAARRCQLSFPDGIYFVDLAPLYLPEQMLPAVASATGFSFAESASPELQFANYLRPRQILLILDNFEHLLEAAGLVSRLLNAAPGLRVLATSRERLALSSEWVVEISGLTFPSKLAEPSAQPEAYSALGLFLNSARRVDQTLVYTPQNHPSLQQICQLVEGMPLGLELSAAWVRTLTLEEIASEIRNSLDFLATGIRDLPERHRSLRAVFSHSWELLNEAEQEAFARLSVFRGPFTREAAQVVAGASLPMLASLYDKSLMVHQPDGRYSLHELLRQFAAERLAAVQENESSARATYAAYYAAKLASWEQEIKSEHQVVVLLVIDGEVDNLRAAWDWMAAQHQVDNLRQAWFSVWFYFETRWMYPAGLELADQAIQGIDRVPGKAAQLLQAVLLAVRGWFRSRLGEQELALADVRLALEQAAPYPDEAAAYFPYLAEAIVEMRFAHQARALQATLKMRDGMRHCGAWFGEAVALHEMGYWYQRLGQLAEARQALVESLAIASPHGEPRRKSIALYRLGEIAAELGDFEEAQARLIASRQVIDTLRDDRYLANWLIAQSRVYFYQSRYSEALDTGQEALELAARISDWYLEFTYLLDLGRMARRSAEFDRSRQYLQSAYQLAGQYNAPGPGQTALIEYVVLLEMQEYFDQALQLVALLKRLEDQNPGAAKRLADLETGLLDKLPAQHAAELIQRAAALNPSGRLSGFDPFKTFTGPEAG
jgi:predicted ATPase/DNA-binding XRE family transcriptional regulator